MPCYQVRTMSVSFQAQNKGLLEQSLKALSWEVLTNVAELMVVRPKGAWSLIRLDLKTGKAVLEEGQQPFLNQLKQQYSQQAVKLLAKRKGWTVQFAAPNKGTFAKKQWG